MNDSSVTAAHLVSTVVTADGARQIATGAEIRALVSAGKFFWIDLVGNGEAAREALLGELGLDSSDLDWIQRFGQSGRMSVGPQRLRTVTWIAAPLGHLSEVHLLCTPTCVVTAWSGDAEMLGEIREHLADRAKSLEKSSYLAAAILLQLLLGTLHYAISELDDRLQALREQLKEKPGSIDFATLTGRLQRLQSAWSDIDRYSSAVRTAIVGVEALPNIDQRAAAELNDYADQVEDVEQRLQVRTRWGSEIVQDYAAAIAQRQGEQINRLTIVSLIFLPITFLTGFFGMNFNWMIDSLGSPVAFIILGLLLPAMSVLGTVLWFKRRGLM